MHIDRKVLRFVEKIQMKRNEMEIEDKKNLFS